MLEYERRFVVSGGLPRVCASLKPVKVKDGYLLAEKSGPPLRLRVTTDSEGKEKYELTAKVGTGISRDEYTWPLACMPDKFCPLANHGKVFSVEKLRYEWTGNDGLKLHVESLGSDAKLIAEVEGPKEAVDSYRPPANWHEVTNDNRFSNFAIAANGWPTTV